MCISFWFWISITQCWKSLNTDITGTCGWFLPSVDYLLHHCGRPQSTSQLRVHRELSVHRSWAGLRRASGIQGVDWLPGEQRGYGSALLSFLFGVANLSVPGRFLRGKRKGFCWQSEFMFGGSSCGEKLKGRRSLVGVILGLESAIPTSP